VNEKRQMAVFNTRLVICIFEMPLHAWTPRVEKRSGRVMQHTGSQDEGTALDLLRACGPRKTEEEKHDGFLSTFGKAVLIDSVRLF
jgi:hypothetical protein